MQFFYTWYRPIQAARLRLKLRQGKEEGAQPHIGEVGKLEEVEEERIEVTCDDTVVKDVIAAIKKIHPYEEIALDVYKLEDY